MKALIFSVLTLAISAQAMANTCNGRAGGTPFSEEKYSRALPDSNQGQYKQAQPAKTATSKGADGTRRGK